jgi:carbon storage regulator
VLVLSRKLEESIMIGDKIEIKIIAVHGETVKLGISAPRDIPVHRKEVYEEIERENIRAASVGMPVEKIDLSTLIFKEKKTPSASD